MFSSYKLIDLDPYKLKYRHIRFDKIFIRREISKAVVGEGVLKPLGTKTFSGSEIFFIILTN